MAKVKKNIVTQGLSGKLGGTIVFRQCGGNTIVQVMPERTRWEPTEAQKKQTNKFKGAVMYAQSALQNDSVKATYAARAKGGQYAHNVAIADYLNAPYIEEIDLNDFDGRKGSRLFIRAIDDHLVTEVQIAIYQADGSLLEEGSATLADNQVDWVYVTQKATTSLSSARLVVRAFDMPGNTTEQEYVLA